MKARDLLLAVGRPGGDQRLQHTRRRAGLQRVVILQGKTRVWFARSLDSGATWSAPVKINNQASLNDQLHPKLAVDETDGTLGITYYDTVADPAAGRPTSGSSRPTTTAQAGRRRRR